MVSNKNEIKQGEMLCTTTVRIEAFDEDGYQYTGTGFYYSINQPNNTYIPLIITNNHVVKNKKSISVVITIADKDGNRLNNHFKYQVDGVNVGIVSHPNSAIDLCAITILPIIEDLQKEGKELFAYYIDSSIIPTGINLSNLDAIEDILMIGYPDGLWDEVNNMPLVRKGITATHPDIDYNGKAEFLIDAACFGGSSGSPVFYLDKSYKTELQPGIHGHKAYLLGVLYAGPQTLIEGFTINPDEKITTISKTMMNLGFVIKSNCFLELENEVLAKFD